MQQQTPTKFSLLLPYLKRYSAVIEQYENPEGAVPEKLRLRCRISLIATVGVALLNGFHNLKYSQHRSSLDPLKQQQFSHRSKILTLGLIAMVALHAFNCYSVVRSIPEDRLQQRIANTQEKLKAAVGRLEKAEVKKEIQKAKLAANTTGQQN